jgi:Putative metal-binding motif
MRRLLAGIVIALVFGSGAQAYAYEFRPSWGYAFVDERPFNEPAGGAFLPATEVFPRGMIRDTIVDQKDVRMIVSAFTAGSVTPVTSYHVNEGDFVDKSFDRRIDARTVAVSSVRYQFCRITPPDGANEVCEPALTINRPPPPAPVPVDADGDGVSPPADCADNNATVRPGAPEVAGNGIDEDCDGRDAPGRLFATVSSKWRVTGKGARVKRLQITEAPGGAVVRVGCVNKRCRFKARSVNVTRAGRANLKRFFKGRLRFRTVIEVRITAPNMIGKVVRYRIRRGALPKSRRLCLPPGVSKPRKC